MGKYNKDFINQRVPVDRLEFRTDVALRKYVALIAFFEMLSLTVKFWRTFLEPKGHS